METITYEEDLHTNPLYIRLIDKYSLLQEVCINNWIVALPKRSSFSTNSLSNHEFMLSHILTPSEELPKTHFYNLLGDDLVIIDGNKIKVKNDSNSFTALILFEEYFYKDSQRYKIICIDKPLSTKFFMNVSNSCNNNNSDSVVKNVQQSKDLIRQSCSKQVERKIDNGIKNFNLRIQKATDYESLQTNIKLLYDYCINITINRKLKESDAFLCINIKFAIEYILLDSIYDKIFDAIIINFMEENEKFNTILRKLSNITLNDLHVSHTISSKILENFKIIRMEMLKIEHNKTSLDKLSCVKNTIDLISTLVGNVSTDILLPILVYVIVKSNFFYWIPTLTFIKDYNLSGVLSAENQSSGSALLYILTTLEAIIYFIQTNENICLESNQLFPLKEIEDITSQEDYLLHLFKLVKDSNETQLTKLLNISYKAFKKETLSNQNSPCHPLCSCPKCETAHTTESTSLVNEKSHHNNLTMLHIAAAYNSPKIVSILINLGADVNAGDSCGYIPLHYASQKGYQKVLFLLLHNQNNSVNLRTNDQKTALILASMYGHEQCVKALLFFAEHTHSAIDVNSQDVDGMTALHYAVQCGFKGIVENLIEYQAKVTLKNGIGKLPLDYARCSIIREKLEDAAKYQVEELPITENEFIFVRREDLADSFNEVT